MKSFAGWVERRTLLEDIEDVDDPADKYKLNSDGDMADDYDRTLTELIKAVMSKYEQETMQFLTGIAERGDEEIADILRRLSKENRPSDFEEPEHPTSGREVVPPESDTGYSDGGLGD